MRAVRWLLGCLGRAVSHPPGRRGLREVGAKGGGTGAGDSGGAEEDEDAKGHSTQRRLVVEMGNPVGTACWPGVARGATRHV